MKGSSVSVPISPSTSEGTDRKLILRPREQILPEVYLHSGQTHVSEKPVLLKMILGSCVGVFLFDPTRAIGGATHFLLPDCQSVGESSSRCGDVAIYTLVEGFDRRGCRRSDLRARLYGGASMFEALRSNRSPHVGKRNTQSAIEILSRDNIRIVDQDTLGKTARKVVMRSDTGEISMTLIGGAHGNR